MTILVTGAPATIGSRTVEGLTDDQHNRTDSRKASGHTAHVRGHRHVWASAARAGRVHHRHQ